MSDLTAVRNVLDVRVSSISRAQANPPRARFSYLATAPGDGANPSALPARTRPPQLPPDQISASNPTAAQVLLPAGRPQRTLALSNQERRMARLTNKKLAKKAAKSAARVEKKGKSAKAKAR